MGVTPVNMTNTLAQRSGGVTVVVSVSRHREVVQRLPPLSSPVTSPCRMGLLRERCVGAL